MIKYNNITSLCFHNYTKILTIYRLQENKRELMLKKCPSHFLSEIITKKHSITKS